jgi:hypothetical protein
MKSIDAEIAAVEQRIGARKVALAYTASATKQRALKRMTSPAMLIGAVAVGFLAAGAIRRRKAKPERVPDRRKSVREEGKKKGFALGTLLMTGLTWLVRSQFGGPVGLAQFVLSKVRQSRSPATAATAELPRQVPR